MVLVGLFALLFWLMGATPAHAIPVAAVAAILAVEATATIAIAITAVLNIALSMALSFVASALFKRSPTAAAAPGVETPINTNFNVRVAAGPRTVVYGRRRVAGTYGLLHLVQNNQGLNMVILLAGHPCQSVDQIMVGEEVFDFPADFDSGGFLIKGRMAGFIRVRAHLGDPSQAADQDLIDDIALYGGSSDVWGPDHRLRGICYLYVRLQFGPSPFPGDPNGQPPLFSDGIPNISAVIKGKKDIYDPRTATAGYSANPALCVANYLCDATYGFGIDYATRIDETALIAAANACDEDVSTPDGGTENRFECNGAFQSSEQPQTVLGWLLGSMHGRAPYDGERWTIQAGVYHTPTLSFSDDDLRGEMTVESITSRRDLFNTVKGTFTSPDHNWQEFDFPPVPNGANAYATVDGKTIYKDINLPFTTSVTMAQRIAKIELQKARKQITVKAKCKLSVWLAQAGDTVMWTSAELGWTSKPFDVRKATFVIEEGEGGMIYGVDLDLAETAPSVYSMDVSEQQLLADMPATNLRDIRTVVPPTNLTATEVIYTTLEGGGLKSRIDLAWTASPDGTAHRYQPEYKRRADADFTVLPQTSGTTYAIENLEPGIFDLRVTAMGYAGNLSAYLTGSITVTGIGAPPENVSGLTLLPTGGLAQMRWTPPDDLGLRAGGGIEFRHAPVSSGATWATATAIGEVGVPALGFHILPLKAGTYLALYFNRLQSDARQYGATPATIYTAQVALAGFTTLVTSTQDPGFAGTKTQLAVASGKLAIASGKSIGQYAWPFIDLGSVKKCRVTIGCAAAVVSNSDLVDSWADIDARPSWDTVASGHEATVRHRIRWTNDDPAGSPTWSSWQKVDVGEFEARGFSIETEIESIDTTWNAEISALSAVVAELT